jgi:hypothetical protein
MISATPMSPLRLADARALPLLAGAFVVGLAVPDLDFFLPFVRHRSGLTHSVLPALAVWWQARSRVPAAGIGLGSGLHLAADTFPNAMVGYATVKLPFAGSIGATWSYAWLGLNAVAALTLGAAMLRASGLPHARAIGAAIAAGGALYLLTTDGGWWALGLFGLAGGAAYRLRRLNPP